MARGTRVADVPAGPSFLLELSWLALLQNTLGCSLKPSVRPTPSPGANVSACRASTPRLLRPFVDLELPARPDIWSWCAALPADGRVIFLPA